MLLTENAHIFHSERTRPSQTKAALFLGIKLVQLPVTRSRQNANGNAMFLPNTTDHQSLLDTTLPTQNAHIFQPELTRPCQTRIAQFLIINLVELMLTRANKNAHGNAMFLPNGTDDQSQTDTNLLTQYAHMSQPEKMRPCLSKNAIFSGIKLVQQPRTRSTQNAHGNVPSSSTMKDDQSQLDSMLLTQYAHISQPERTQPCQSKNAIFLGINLEQPPVT